MTSESKPDRADPLMEWREEFPVLSRCTYLASHSLGAMPASVYSQLRSYADLWAAEGVAAWETWLPMVNRTGDLLAKIIGAESGEILMLQNVSLAQSIIASCFDFSAPRNKVIYTSLNFPAVHYVWQAQKRRGARVEVIPSEDGIGVPTERIIDAIDEETLILPLSHVYFRSAYLQDTKPIIEAAHRKGAIVVLDSYQAVGTVPIDVKDLGVDFLVGGSVKWLCGGAGAAYLYASKEVAERYQPVVTGWFSHARPFDFDMDEMEYAPGVQRFMGGTPSVPSLYTARAGYEIIREVGVDRIREKSKRQTGRLLEGAKEMGLELHTPTDPDRRGGSVTVNFPEAEGVHNELNRRGFIVDYRPEAGIRISPHFYTSDEEIEAVLEEIRLLRAN
ncbi:MAG: aminotransferase class V-fold PLP-dependent enzyme [Planctomycetota bacterium]|nr:aminotransferase class V-fold PLP-dependent enzyme [Planctomycetota bacterium]